MFGVNEARRVLGFASTSQNPVSSLRFALVLQSDITGSGKNRSLHWTVAPYSHCRAGRNKTNTTVATSERNAARRKAIAGCTAHNAPAVSDAGT